MKKLCHFIRACCVLHNIAHEDDLNFSSGMAPEVQEVTEDFPDHGQVSRGNFVRDRISQYIQTHINDGNPEL